MRKCNSPYRNFALSVILKCNLLKNLVVPMNFLSTSSASFLWVSRISPSVGPGCEVFFQTFFFYFVLVFQVILVCVTRSDKNLLPTVSAKKFTVVHYYVTFLAKMEKRFFLGGAQVLCCVVQTKYLHS